MGVQDGWVGVDLDGTLASYVRWDGALQIGDPVPKMVEKVQRLIEIGIEVKIFTARVHPNSVGGKTKEEQQESQKLITDAIKKWCVKHLGVELEVTCSKDMNTIEIWDDRARRVLLNKGEFCCRAGA